MDNPRVTILIATYNDEEYLDRAIESAFNQDYNGPLSICIVDDGSTDNSWDVIGSHFVDCATSGDGVKYNDLKIYTEHNIGRFDNTTYIVIRQPNGGPSAA